MHKPIASFAALALVSLLAGCVHSGIGNIKAGVSTEEEVRARLGTPGRVWQEADGGRLLEYSGQPNGTFCHLVRVGTDGRVREIRQAFAEENFRRIVPGLTQDEVRRRLCAPEEKVRYHLRPQEEAWSWRIAESTEKIDYFNAYFGGDGRLLRSDRTVIYKASGPAFD